MKTNTVYVVAGQGSFVVAGYPTIHYLGGVCVRPATDDDGWMPREHFSSAVDGDGYPLSTGRSAHLDRVAAAHARHPHRRLAREIRRTVARGFSDCIDPAGLLDAARSIGAGSYWLQ